MELDLDTVKVTYLAGPIASTRTYKGELTPDEKQKIVDALTPLKGLLQADGSPADVRACVVTISADP